MSCAAAGVGLLALIGGRPIRLFDGVVLVGALGVGPLVLVLRRWPAARPHLAPLALALAVAVLAGGTWVSGGLAGPWLVWWLVLPVATGFVAGARPAVAVALAAALVLAGLGVAPLLGLSPLPAPQAPAARLVHVLPAGGVALALAWRWERLVRARSRAEQRAARTLRTLAENIHAGAILAENGSVTWANAEAQRLLGAAAVGAPLAEAIPGLGPTASVDLDASLPDLGLPARTLTLALPGGGTAAVDVRRAAVHLGDTLALLVTLVDQTEQRAAERARLEAQARLQEARRLDLLGQVAGGMAHDFNNLLVGLLTNTELLLESPDLTADDRELAAETREASERAAALVRKLQAWAGCGARAPRPLLLGDIADEVAQLVRPEAARHRARITVGHGTDLPAVDADPADLRLVVSNLVDNAVAAVGETGGPGHVVLRTRLVEAEAADLSQSLAGQPAPGRFVAIEVQDDGPGIDPGIRSRVMEPFFGTRRDGHGLGLPAVETVVRRLGGALFLEPAPGGGTRARVLLRPATTRPATPSPHPRPVDLSGQPVLVVDDEPQVRRLLDRLLRGWGADVHVASDVREARAALAAASRPWALVVTDFVMPDGSGVDVARAARAADPNVPLVLCSGFISQRGDADEVFDAVLHKPFLPDALQGVVHATARATGTRQGGGAVG